MPERPVSTRNGVGQLPSVQELAEAFDGALTRLRPVIHMVVSRLDLADVAPPDEEECEGLAYALRSTFAGVSTDVREMRGTLARLAESVPPE